MAVRNTMLKLSNGDLQVMNAADIATNYERAIVEYNKNPSIDLINGRSQGSPYERIDGAMVDTYYKPGQARLSNTGYFSDTPDVVKVEITGASLGVDQILDDVEDNWTATPYPLYWNSSGELQVMSKADFYDTFIAPAIDAWYAPSGSGELAGAGMYAVYSAADPGSPDVAQDVPPDDIDGFTWVVNNYFPEIPFWSDRISADSVRTGPLPEYGALPGEDPQNDYSKTFWLYKKDSVGTLASEQPFYYDSTTEEIKQYTSAQWGSMLQYHTRYAVVNRTGSRLRYEISDTAQGGVILGEGMTDTAYDSFVRRTYKTGDNYYTQEVPAGNVEVLNTYYLKIVKS